MNVDNVVDVREYLDIWGLANPTLEVLQSTEESYRVLLQPSGLLISETN